MLHEFSMENSSTAKEKKIPGPFEWKRLVRDTKGGLNPICLFRSGPTTANFHTDYISIDHYKLLLSAPFHPQECFGTENFKEESLKIKKFPSQTSQTPYTFERDLAGVGVFLVYKINCFYHLSSGEIFSQISSLVTGSG